MRLYKPLSLALALTFAVVGLMFLFIPDRVLSFFDMLSPAFGMPQSPLMGFNFYLILAVGYMYLVTIMACSMYLHPGNPVYPMLLSHAKIASSVLSLGLFLFDAHYLIYLTNFIVDGAIGALVLFFYLKMRRADR